MTATELSKEQSLAKAREQAQQTIAEAKAEAQRLGDEMKASNERELAERVRELLGVERTIEMGIAGGKLPPGELIFFCDNQGASMALQFGSRKAPIHLVCMRIWARCTRNGSAK